ncbi:TPA: SEC-C domain-containing protein [Vibrio parahaemolyticus]|nr:SEC-C domain-containing protein [Vibrio parahaemolyticus]
MNEDQAHQLKEANVRAIGFESVQGDVYTDDEIIHIIKQALKPANRNRPCQCGSGKKYKKCCRAEHVVKFNQFQKEHDL